MRWTGQLLCPDSLSLNHLKEQGHENMVMSHSAEVGVKVINCKIMRLHLKVEVCFEQLIKSGAMSALVSGAQVAFLRMREFLCIDTATRQAWGHRSAPPTLSNRIRSRSRTVSLQNQYAQLQCQSRCRREEVYSKHFRLIQLAYRVQSKQSAQPITARLHATHIKLR